MSNYHIFGIYVASRRTHSKRHLKKICCEKFHRKSTRIEFQWIIVSDLIDSDAFKLLGSDAYDRELGILSERLPVTLVMIY